MRRRSPPYADDHQVHALAVTCHHGETAPSILAFACPFGSLLEDLEVAKQFARERTDNHYDWEESACFDRTLDEVREMQRDEAGFRARFGDHAYESLLRHARQEAQEQLLGRGALTPTDLAMLYNVSSRALGIDLAAMWEQTSSTPLRITLSELPQATDGSTLWKREIEDKLRAFQARFGWLIDPLLVPVALEVVIKPPPQSRQNGPRDLDNVLRTYLIPRVVEILKPVSDEARFVKWRDRFPNPPASTPGRGDTL